VDLVSGRLPWTDGSFECVVGQPFIDDLEIEGELIPLLKEIRRVLKPGGGLWVSTPDMEKLCRSYIADGGAALVADRRSRIPGFSLEGYPNSHYMNVIFFEGGRNMNLFDFPLLREVFRRAGFPDCRRVDEEDLLERYPDFPPRRDDYQSLYVLAVKPDS
jgi:SAM-dependent methyltransferase